MTYEEIRRAITSRMATFAGIEQSRIDYPNQPDRFEPPLSGLWCRLSIQFAPAFMAGMAAMPYTRKPGLIVIQCFDREQSGMQGLTELADKLETHFAYWRDGDLECLEASLIPAGRSGGYEQANVRVPFRAG